ncbi:MAG: tRNA preQ1(34) S-adenosylmethionine ribosyltransferase-isomerase QueA [Bacilli bacterium]|nr:tRNA preQ1(34) S-adenosylmethionine ribosyltransferase-isomerase QueA [Bacilli bacterium]
MKTDDFDYYLPKELIAQSPLEKRDASKMMVLDKVTGSFEHKMFHDLIDYLNPGDTIVLNNTKVLPARLIGNKPDTGAVVELLMLRQMEYDCWECLSRPAKRVKKGTIVNFSERLKAVCMEVKADGLRIFKFIYSGVFFEILDELGEMPLPPYITKKLEDKGRYQTVYAKTVGSAAAPTAGLHFTNEYLDKIKKKGVNVAFITLHVGLGTFRPVVVEDVTKHEMHEEYYEVSKDVSRLLNETRKNGKRIIAVGTTSVRTLESVVDDDGNFKAQSGFTKIFIYPGYKFKAIDALLTNFHLPKSTLIMLISALAGKNNVLDAYEEAVKQRYRFFSFGDCMFIK